MKKFKNDDERIAHYTKPSVIARMRPRRASDFQLVEPLECEACDGPMTVTGRLPTVNKKRSWARWITRAGTPWTLQGEDLDKIETRYHLFPLCVTCAKTMDVFAEDPEWDTDPLNPKNR